MLAPRTTLVGDGRYFEVLDATNGHVLFPDEFGAWNLCWGYPSVSHGKALIGGDAGQVYDFGLPAGS